MPRALVAVLVLWARAARADPPVTSVLVEPASLRLGVDRAAAVTVNAPDDPPVARVALAVSTGTLTPLERTGPGRFVAQYTPPASRAPDVAVFVACAGDAAERCASTTLALAGRYHLTLAVEPFARVAVQVGDDVEQRADAPASGALDMVLHVPPGVERARIVATDRVGNRTETLETLELPLEHRVALLALGSSARVRGGGAIHWVLAAATPDGQPAPRAPALDVDGGPYVVVPRAPGVFEVVATPPRRALDATVALRVTAGDLVAEPARLEAVAQGSAPATIAMARVAQGTAGDALVVPFAVRAPDGAAVVGLAGELRARVAGTDGARVEARGDGYAVVALAPEHTGTVAVRVALPASGGRLAIEAGADALIGPGPAVRVLADHGTAIVGQPFDVALRALDRFGNPAVIGHPTVRALGATVSYVGPAAGGDALVARVRPTSTEVHLEVRGDYDLSDAVDLIAQVPVARPLSMSLVGVARWNLGALVIGGARYRLEGDATLNRYMVLAAMVEGGCEAANVNDAQGRSVELIIVPAQVRLGLLVQLGVLAIGPLGGLGARVVWASFREATGGTTAQNTVLPLFSAGLLVRVRVPVGAALVEAGYETGVLDTLVASGTFGGFEGELGWAYAF